MFKNQLQELAQRSCFNLPSYACIREGPDHAPRFRASVNFNGEIFESPAYSTTLRQAEHAAAEVALNSLSARGPSKSLTARVLDETGVYKNLLQETAHRAGLKLPVYTTVRSGPGHVPVFTSTVEIAGMSFSGEAAKTKKQAEKNAAISAWSSLKRMPNLGPLSQNSKELDTHHRRDENRVTRRGGHQYQRGRMQRPQNQKRPWKFIDSFPDPISENCVQNHNNFLSLLPPPPPRTMPRILPPNLYPSKTEASAIKTMGSSQVQEDDNEWINKISEAIKKPGDGKPLHYNQTGSGALKMVGNSLVEDDNEWINKISEAIKKPAEVRGSNSHFRGGKSLYHNQTGGNSPQVQEDDNEWINKISEAIKKPVEGKSLYFNQTGGNSRTGKGIDVHGFSKSSMYPVNFKSSCSNQMGLSGFNGGQRFAPAVQIRSVIPVCAAPPPLKKADPAAAEAEVASKLRNLKL
ncbi:hypothetical protein ACS0TY_000521 [Phlomoides rotata]